MAVLEPWDTVSGWSSGARLLESQDPVSGWSLCLWLSLGILALLAPPVQAWSQRSRISWD